MYCLLQLAHHELTGKADIVSLTIVSFAAAMALTCKKQMSSGSVRLEVHGESRCRPLLTGVSWNLLKSGRRDAKVDITSSKCPAGHSARPPT